MNNAPTEKDFNELLKVLSPYKSQLEIIHQAFENDEFDSIEVNEPWDTITYFRHSKRYQELGIKPLSLDVYHSLKKLKVYPYDAKTFDNIHMRLSTEQTNNFESWGLDEVYHFLLMLIEDINYEDGQIDEILIENALVTGDFYKILMCFIRRAYQGKKSHANIEK